MCLLQLVISSNVGRGFQGFSNPPLTLILRFQQEPHRLSLAACKGVSNSMQYNIYYNSNIKILFISQDRVYPGDYRYYMNPFEKDCNIL